MRFIDLLVTCDEVHAILVKCGSLYSNKHVLDCITCIRAVVVANLQVGHDNAS